MRSLRPIAESKGIAITVESFENAVVLADHDATLAIANNLISNAIHYTPSGGDVSVTCSRNTEYWTLTVQDNGVGIPLAEQERVFERFYRVNRTRNSASGGTGIGLAIVKNLTVAQDGKIHLQSVPGEGAKFQIQLPIASSASGMSSKST